MSTEVLPPEKPDSSGHGEGNEPSKNILVGPFHYHGNDLTELRKLSESNPELADQVVKNANKQDARWHFSERFGLAVTLLMVVAAMAFVYAVVASVGLWATLLASGLLLALGVLIRVILTGEWSETTWFGKLVATIARALGSEAGGE